MPLATHERAYAILPIKGWVGLASDQPALAIPITGCAVAENCTIRDGIVERILGYQQWGDAASGICYGGPWQFKKHEADGSVTRTVIVLWGTTLTKYSADGSVLSSIGSLTGNVYATACQAGNRMFFSNGSDTPKVYDGTSVQEVNCPVPTTPTHVQFNDSGGYLELDGAYELRTTFYDPVNGDESNPSVVLAQTCGPEPGISGTDNTWQFDQPPTSSVPARFTVLRVYRTEKDLKEHRYEKEWTSFDPSAGDTDLICGDTLADGDLAAEAEVDTNNDSMPSYQIIYFWDNRIWGLGDKANPTLLGRSKALQYTAWDVQAPMELGQKDGIPLRGMSTHPVAKGRLYVFKRAKAFQVSEDYAVTAELSADTTYASSEIPGGIGLLDHWACAQKDGALWGLGDGVLWRFDGSRFDSVSESLFSDEMALWKSADNVAPVFMIPDNAEDRGEIVICCYYSGSHRAYLFNPKTGGLTRYIPGSTDVGSWKPAVLERSDGRDWIVMGSRDGKLYEFFEPTTKGAGVITYVNSAIQKFKTGAIDPDPSNQYKMARWIDIFLAKPTTFQPDESDAYELYIWYDDIVAEPTPIEFGPYGSVTENIQKFTIGLTGEHFQYLALDVRCKTNDKAFRLLGFRLAWKPVGQLTAL